MTRIRRALVALIALAAVGCTPAQIQWFTHDATPAQQAAVVSALQEQARARAAASRAIATDCYAAARRHFPSSQWSKAYRIIDRESGGNTYAKNKRSSASGCFQIVAGSWRHPTVGFYDGRFHADTNARAARIMWDGNGWNCTCTWAATA